MSETSQAVFLSYASQDIEAAKKICDALRAAGVEVWFDQSELVGGDAWDAKIRGQIGSCGLFVPVISANTQARLEGYFRLEWKLAAQRTHTMADEKTFLLPVVIDGTRDVDAKVPTEFKAVQWTKLSGGETPEKFCERVKRLLSGDAPHLEPGRPRPGQRDEDVASPSKRKPPRSIFLPVIAVIAVLVLAIGAYLALRPRLAPPEAAKPSPAAATVAAPTAPAEAAEFPRDPDLRRAWNLIFNAVNAEDFALAEEIVKAAVQRHPTDSETVIVYAWLNDSYINRGFDMSEERFVLGKRYADRAVQLAPNDPEALAALGQFLSFRNADLPRAEQLLRRAIELNPREPRFYRALAHNVLSFSRPADGLLFSEHVAELFPQDALAHYELALAYRDADRVNDMERAFDQSLALAPVAGAIIWKAWIVGWRHGDVPGMKSWLDRLPAESRLIDRAVIVRYQYSILSQQPAEVADALRTLQAFPGPTLRDFFFTGPKALLIGDLYAAQGKAELAKGQYEAALAEIDHDKISAPADYGVLSAEYWTLLGLGRRAEALSDVRLVIGSRSPEFRQRFYRWWFSTVPAALLLGDRELALEEIKQLAASAGPSQLRMAFRIDPRVAAFRDDAEIMALIAEPPKTTAAPPPVGAAVEAPAKVDEKSVAVLAFANLSDDKGNEYFSDGISEELLNVLAKVPGLKVTARTSSFYFKGKEVPIPEIAQKLGVAYVLEGSVRKSGDRVRITAQLIKAADGFQVWSDQFDRELKDIFAVQDEIAGLIAKNLSLKLGTAATKREVNPQAYALFLRARQEWNARTLAGYARADSALKDALELEPDFAAALALRATLVTTRDGSIQPFDATGKLRPFLEEATGWAERAVNLDPDSAETHVALGAVEWITWRHAEAERELRRAIAISPSHARAFAVLGRILEDEGRLEEGITSMQRSVELDPLAWRAFDNLALMMGHAGRLTEAMAAADRALALQPDDQQDLAYKAWLLEEAGRNEEAAPLVARMLAIGKDPVLTQGVMGYECQLLIGLGKVDEAKAFYRRIPDDYPVEKIVCGLALGLREESLARLGSLWLPAAWADEVLWSQQFDSVRGTVEFTAFLKRVGLTEAHAQAQAWRAAHPRQKLEVKP